MSDQASEYVVDEANEQRLLRWLRAGAWTREEATLLLIDIRPHSFTSECFATFSGFGQVQFDYFDDECKERIPCGHDLDGDLEYLTAEQETLFQETKKRLSDLELILRPTDFVEPHAWVELACKKGIIIPWLAWANSRGFFVQDEVADEGLNDPVGEGALTQDTKWHLLATPAELIAAFGTLTGMNKGWFKKVQDKPQLRVGRHSAGEGGRRGSEPLFKVYEVMTWLIDRKRKTGKKISEETGWRLLKGHFPKVYTHYEGYAPDPIDRG